MSFLSVWDVKTSIPDLVAAISATSAPSGYMSWRDSVLKASSSTESVSAVTSVTALSDWAATPSTHMRVWLSHDPSVLFNHFYHLIEMKLLTGKYLFVNVCIAFPAKFYCKMHYTQYQSNAHFRKRRVSSIIRKAFLEHVAAINFKSLMICWTQSLSV